MHDLTAKETSAGTTKPIAGTPDPDYSMVVDTWKSLENTGLKVIEIGKIQRDIQLHGLKAVVNNPNSGLSEDQKAVLVRDYKKSKNATSDNSSPTE